MNVSGFLPTEINVWVRGGKLVVEGGHEDREEDGTIVMRKFMRTFNLPENLNCDAIKTDVNSESILRITIPQVLFLVEFVNQHASFFGNLKSETGFESSNVYSIAVLVFHEYNCLFFSCFVVLKNRSCIGWVFEKKRKKK